MGNALTGLRAVVAPVLKLRGELVELVVGVYGVSIFMFTSKSLDSFNKDDCRLLKIEIHACLSEPQATSP
jgi:hypothetical protein